MTIITRMLTILLVLMTIESHAQDPVFSQHFSSPLNINPALTGVTTAPRLNLSYRNQWPSWPNAYRTYAVSYDHPVEFINSAFGVMAMADDAGNGIYKTTSFMGTYSYQVRASKDLFLKLGFELGVQQTRLDWEQLVFADQLDPRVGLQENTFSAEMPPEQFNRTSLDLGTGLLIYHTNYYGGISLKHINRPDESWLNINQNLNLGRPMRLTMHAGAEFSVNAGNNRLGASFISPNLLYIRQGPFTQVNVGAYAGYERVFGGVSYRHTSQNGDAAILLAGFRYGVLRIAYSYDVTISGLSLGATGGSHEISVSFNLADSRILQQKRKRNETINCFKIFN